MEIEKFKLTITALKRYSIFVTKSCTIFHFRYRNTLKCITTSVFNVKKSKNLITVPGIKKVYVVSQRNNCLICLPNSRVIFYML